MKLRARWEGDPPDLDTYLMAPVRPRYAYRIVAVDLVRWLRETGSLVGMFEFTVERMAANAVPVGATVYPWRWDKRTPKARR